MQENNDFFYYFTKISHNKKEDVSYNTPSFLIRQVWRMAIHSQSYINGLQRLVRCTERRSSR